MDWPQIENPSIGSRKLAQSDAPHVFDGDKFKVGGLGAVDLTPLDLSHTGQPVQWSASDRAPMAPPHRQPNPDQTPELAKPPEPSQSRAGASGRAVATESNDYFHGMAKQSPTQDATSTRTAVRINPAVVQPPGILPRTSAPDAYYQGAIPRTRFLNGVGNAADVLVPLGSAIGANAGVKSIYAPNYPYKVTGPQRAAYENARGDLQDVIRQARRAEVDEAAVQMRSLAAKIGINPGKPNLWSEIDQKALSSSEQGIFDRWNYFRSPPVDAHSLRLAEQATSDPLVHLQLTNRTATLGLADAEHQGALRAAEIMSTGMRNSSLLTLGAGEVINFAMDRTTFKGTPHSLRTIISDMVAPAIVFAKVPVQYKLLVVVATHLLNRNLDKHTKDVGTF